MIHPVHGHRELRRSLARAHRRGTLPASLLFHGPRGVGKQRLALWLGQLLACDTPVDDEPCGRCRGCKLTLRLEHPDVHWYFPLIRPRGTAADKLGEALEEARAERLAELRETPLQPSVGDEDPSGIYLAAAQTLRRRAQSRPHMAPGQLFIIADAEALVPQESSQEAANALLKLLEEPPSDTRFLLTSSEPGSLLDTIRSRTVPVHVPPLPPGEVEAFLRESLDVDADEARRAARLGQGAPGRALGFLTVGGEPGPLTRIHDTALELVRAALSPGPGPGLQLALQEFKSTGARGLLELFAAVEGWLRDLAAVLVGDPDRAVRPGPARELAAAAREAGVEPAALADALPLVDEATLQARGNVNPQLIVTGLASGLRSRLRATTP